MLNEPVSISVVIPALNEERFIRRCLSSLAAVTYSGRWEVIVVDNGSVDRTAEIARSFASVLDIRVLVAAGLRPSGLRNLGARAAKGERLLFLDADCVVRADWLEVSSEVAGCNEAVLLGAPFTLPPEASWVARTWWEYEQRDRKEAVSYLSAHNLHIRRQMFLDLGGFDETLETNEDFEFSQRARVCGAIAEDARLSVTHLGNPETLASHFRRERWHGRDVFRVFWRDVRKRHNLRAVAFAAYTLLCVLSAGGAFVAVSWRILAGSLLAMAAAPVVLALRAAMQGHTRSVLRLAVLFQVYGIARAVALLDSGRDSAPRVRKVATSS